MGNWKKLKQLETKGRFSRNTDSSLTYRFNTNVSTPVVEIRNFDIKQIIKQAFKQSNPQREFAQKQDLPF